MDRTKYPIVYSQSNEMTMELAAKFIAKIEQIYNLVQNRYNSGNGRTDTIVMTGSAALLYYIVYLGYNDLIKLMPKPNDVDLLILFDTKQKPMINVGFIDEFKKTTDHLQSSATFINSSFQDDKNVINKFDLTYIKSSSVNYYTINNINLINLKDLLAQYNYDFELRSKDAPKIELINKILEKIKRDKKDYILVPAKKSNLGNLTHLYGDNQLIKPTKLFDDDDDVSPFTRYDMRTSSLSDSKSSKKLSTTDPYTPTGSLNLKINPLQPGQQRSSIPSTPMSALRQSPPSPFTSMLSKLRQRSPSSPTSMPALKQTPPSSSTPMWPTIARSTTGQRSPSSPTPMPALKQTPSSSSTSMPVLKQSRSPSPSTPVRPTTARSTTGQRLPSSFTLERTRSPSPSTSMPALKQTPPSSSIPVRPTTARSTTGQRSPSPFTLGRTRSPSPSIPVRPTTARSTTGQRLPSSFTSMRPKLVQPPSSSPTSMPALRQRSPSSSTSMRSTLGQTPPSSSIPKRVRKPKTSQTASTRDRQPSTESKDPANSQSENSSDKLDSPPPTSSPPLSFTQRIKNLFSNDTK